MSKVVLNPSIILAYCSLFLLGSVDNIRGPLYPYLLETFKINESYAQWMFTLSSVIGLITSITAPKWLKHIPPINTLKITILMHSMALLLMGIGIELIEFKLILIASISLGIAMGAQGICVNTIIAAEVKHKNSRKIFSGLHSMYGISSLLSPFLLGLFFKNQLNVSTLFYLMSLVTFLIFVYTLRTPKLKSVKEIKGMDFNFLNRNVLRYGILLCAYVSFEILISSRLSLVLKNHFMMSYGDSAYYLSLFFIGLLAGRLFFSFFHLNISNSRLLLTSCYINLLLLIGGLYFNPILLAITGLSSSFFFPTVMDTIKNNVMDNEVIITKIMILVSLSLSLLHPVFSIISDYYGSFNAMHIGFFFLLIVLYFLHFKVDGIK